MRQTPPFMCGLMQMDILHQPTPSSYAAHRIQQQTKVFQGIGVGLKAGHRAYQQRKIPAGLKNTPGDIGTDPILPVPALPCASQRGS